MSKFLILHGTDGSPDSNWFMWLKGVLIGQGHSVWLPQLPHAEQPNANTYTKFLLDNDDFTYDDNTTIIGHSSGAVEILHLLQALPEGTTIKAAVLVGAFKDDLGWESLSDMFTQPFDFEVIRSRCDRFIFVHSDDDPHCPLEHAQYLVEQTGGELVLFEGQGHFNAENSPSYNQFPEILELFDY